MRLLERLGHEAVFPAEQTCCGQMHVNTGYQRQALPLVRHHTEVFAGCDVVVAPSGSCVGCVRHQHAMVARRYGDERLAAAIHRRFGLPAVLPGTIKKKIKAADRISARLEAVQIAGFTESEARRLFPLQNDAIMSVLHIRLRPPAQARAAFLDRFSVLMETAGSPA